MACEHFPDCPIHTLQGPRTADGKQTFMNVCAAGIPGGCGPEDFDQIAEKDEQVGRQLGATRRQAPLVVDTTHGWRSVTRQWPE